MILDKIENAGYYYGLGKRLKTALEFLKTTDFTPLKPGRVEIDGDDIYALIQEYECKRQDETEWEAHRKYTDIHFLAGGEEGIGYAEIGSLDVSGKYDVEEDCILLKGEGDILHCTTGTFAVFFPCDAHRPRIMAKGSNNVRKVVVKVRL